MSLPNGNTTLPDAAAQVQRAKGLYKWLWLSPLLTLPTLGYVVTQVSSIVGGGYRPYEDYHWSALIIVTAGVLGSGLWHLVLLSRALDQQHEFVRWHGWQALLLAGARTAVALALAATAVNDSYGSFRLVGIMFLFLVWLFGTLWGQGQAARGECSLMRWAGRGAVLPLRVAAGQQATLDQMDRASSLQKHSGSADAAQVFRQVLVSDASPEAKAQAADHLLMPGDDPAYDLAGQDRGSASAETADVLAAIHNYSQDPERRRAALEALEQAGLVETL